MPPEEETTGGDGPSLSGGARQGMPDEAGARVHVAGVVQGLVIGDRNSVTINVTRRDSFAAREAPALPQHWVERADIVVRALDALDPGAVVALVGMGGSGKSALAACIAHQLTARFDSGTFWIDVADDDLDQALLRIALAFGHDISPLDSRRARANVVRSLLYDQAVLLVLDDVWEISALDLLLPLPASCAAIITTRNDAIAAHFASDVVEVTELASSDAAALFARVANTAADDPAMPHLADTLGGLPLALELAGKLARKQARRPGFSLTRFTKELGDSAKRLSLGLADATVRAAFEQTWRHALNAETRRAFALLGVFDAGELFTGEVAAAWGAADDDAGAVLSELIDLSLVRLIDPVTLRLHPLLADYAREMAAGVAEEERRQAHCRVADWLCARAARPPRTLDQIRYVLRSHKHAAAAHDRERANRVYPWFGDDSERVAVPGFLIDHGQHDTRVLHERIEYAMLAREPAWPRAFAAYRVGDALADAGQAPAARAQIQEAIDIMEGPEIDDDSRALGLAKFLMRLGQVEASLGDVAAAEAALRRAVDIDRNAHAGGGVGGALTNALISLLQVADLLEQSGQEDGLAEAYRIAGDVFTEAALSGDAQVAVMAIARLARLSAPGDSAHALTLVHQARKIAATYPAAFQGRQGARYARLIGECAASLAMNGEPALDDALALHCIAVTNAVSVQAWQELGHALYQLGNLFEHYHVLEREAPLAAAWACYALVEEITRTAEGGSPLNAQFRIEQRIAPRMDDAARELATRDVAHDPWAVIATAVAPLSIGPSPLADGENIRR